MKPTFTSNNPTIHSLPILHTACSDDSTRLVSYWKPSFRDIFRILIGKPVYLILLSTKRDPVYVGIDKDEIMGREDEQYPDHDTKIASL